jgi:hypothetical protein
MKARSREILRFVACVLTAACSDVSPTRPILGRLSPGDLTGGWNIAFQVDSVRDCASGSCREVAQKSLVPAVGSLFISDQYDTLYTAYLTAELHIDFQLALGRQVTCLGSPQASLVLPGDSGIAHFWFTPGAADCGLYGIGRFDGQEFHGGWGEPSFTSLLLSSGTFRMWRKA